MEAGDKILITVIALGFFSVVLIIGYGMFLHMTVPTTPPSAATEAPHLHVIYDSQGRIISIEPAGVS